MQAVHVEEVIDAILLPGLLEELRVNGVVLLLQQSLQLLYLCFWQFQLLWRGGACVPGLVLLFRAEDHGKSREFVGLSLHEIVLKVLHQ